MAFNKVLLPYGYYGNPIKGAPVGGGSIYVGVVDGDPYNVPSDRKPVTVRQEDGTEISVTQPIGITAGGYPEYNGSVVEILVEGSYSLQVLDSFGAQTFYSSNASEGEAITSETIFSFTDVVFETLAQMQNNGGTLNGTGTTIGGQIVTYSVPQALKVQNESGLFTNYIVTTTSTVTAVDLGLGFWAEPVKDADLPPIEDAIETIRPVNRLASCQNFNCPGKDGKALPGASVTDYAVGEEIAAGWLVVSSPAGQVTYTSGILSSASNTGNIQRKYERDPAGTISKSSQYAAVILSDGTQQQALVDDLSTGCSITDDANFVYVTVDLSILTSGFRFVGLSSAGGTYPAVSNAESYSAWFETLGAVLITASDYVTVGDEPDTVVTDANLGSSVSFSARTVLTNPFQGKCDVEPQILLSGIWTPTFAGNDSNSAYGFIGGAVHGEGIVIQTASAGVVIDGSIYSGLNLANLTGLSAVTSAPMRVWCTPKKTQGGAG